MAESEDFGQTCDECSPCWPHRGWLRVCSCDCHPADPAADLEHAMAVIEHLQAENERLREALTTAGLTPSAVDAIAKGEPPRPCPAGHGSQCCGHPVACAAALSGNSEETP